QARLREAGVTTRRALARLDPDEARRAREGAVPGDGLVAALGREVEHLDQLIYRARVAVDGTLRRRVEPAAMGCARADVEVDVDMESYEDATYLWGAVVSVARAVPGVTAGYHAFATFDPLTPAAEAALFARFWAWLEGVRAACEAAGATFGAYCFWSTAEDGAMDRAVARTPDDALARALREGVDALRAARPARWIDLHDVVSRQVQTAGPLGLKLVASAAGFAWRDPSPSGEASIAWYERAVGEDPVGAAAHRRRLLEYNEDDCRATRALRDWLEGPARRLPHRDEPPAPEPVEAP
ncbi:MAG TPA: TM0106 family RecB-like putative nuclease, partial [Acidimicrobiales bacterium]